MRARKLVALVAAILILSLMLPPALMAGQAPPTQATYPQGRPDANRSHRLIVELDSPPLAVAYGDRVNAAGVNGRLDVNTPDAQAYIAQLQAEQAAFVARMGAVLQDASVSTFINELGVAEEAAYQIVFNGLAVDPGGTDREEAKLKLAKMPGVKAVHYDRAHASQLYTSTTFIGATTVWNSPNVGGAENAGKGIKFASVDEGLHKDAPMFDGTGWDYPAGFPPGGLGMTSNNNGKIIASRAYFRADDPPMPGEENAWPGPGRVSHGVHTGSTAAGNCVDDVVYLATEVGSMCGVAPGAWAMSYKTIYPAVSGSISLMTAEGVAALEDVVADGADVVQNSWGGGAAGYDTALDQALINAVRAGVFVSMSNGNDGPGLRTGDHPSADYINVAASTSGGSFADGWVGISGPGQGGDTFTRFAFRTATFGGSLPIGTVEPYAFKTAAAVQPDNMFGCRPFPDGVFAGVAAVVPYGICKFADKAYSAQQAGATLVIIVNFANEKLTKPHCVGDLCEAITIPVVYVGRTAGANLADWYYAHGDASTIDVSRSGFQTGNVPDVIANFSSRGPSVLGTLKPDIAAPGVDILAQGYAEVDGEARHLGYGQASGTSMAGPHVAGAAVLIRQRHPDWSNAAIKSAMMSTSKYLDMVNFDGTPAQPLDMGAGRLDIPAAMDPGVILDPPSLSFGSVLTETQTTIDVTITSVADAPETYTVSTLYTGQGFTNPPPMAGVTTDMATVALDPGASKVIRVTFDTATALGLGHNQGYVVLTGDNGHAAHLPAWAFVTEAVSPADILIIDADGSYNTDYYDALWYYTSTLDALGYSYTVVDADANAGQFLTIPAVAALKDFDAVILFTGQAYEKDGDFTSPTPFTLADQTQLIAYLDDGGSIIAMGQDLSARLSARVDPLRDPRNTLYNDRFGASYIQDSISDNGPPDAMIVASTTAPAAFRDALIDLTQPRGGFAWGALTGAAEVPPVDTGVSGEFLARYDVDRNLLQVSVRVTPALTTELVVTGAHIHRGGADENGPVVRTLEPAPGFFPVVVTQTQEVAVAITDLVTDEIAAMIGGNLYINLHTTAHPSGEIRGQIMPQELNVQPFVDEIDNVYRNGLDEQLGSNLILEYQGNHNVYSGAVAAARRDLLSLERPVTDYLGRSVYTSFGLEGMDESGENTTRTELLGAMLAWTWAEPTPVTVEYTLQPDGRGRVTLTATLGDGVNATGVAQTNIPVSYRWDLGDGSPFVDSASGSVDHTYACRQGIHDIYTARVEIVDDLGIVSLGSLDLDSVVICGAPTNLDRDPEPLPGAGKVFLPLVER